MLEKQIAATIAAMQKKIKEQTKDFEKRLMSAKNDYALFIVYSEIIGIVESELKLWLQFYVQELEIANADSKNAQDAAEQQILELLQFIQKVVEELIVIHPMALKIQQAQKNMGLINFDVTPLHLDTYLYTQSLGFASLLDDYKTKSKK